MMLPSALYYYAIEETVNEKFWRKCLKIPIFDTKSRLISGLRFFYSKFQPFQTSCKVSEKLMSGFQDKDGPRMDHRLTRAITVDPIR